MRSESRAKFRYRLTRSSDNIQIWRPAYGSTNFGYVAAIWQELNETKKYFKIRQIVTEDGHKK